MLSKVHFDGGTYFMLGFREVCREMLSWIFEFQTGLRRILSKPTLFLKSSILHLNKFSSLANNYFLKCLG